MNLVSLLLLRNLLFSLVGIKKRALMKVFCLSEISVTVFLLGFKTEKTMSVYLKLFIVRTGVESHGSMILKRRGRSSSNEYLALLQFLLPSKDLHKCTLFERYFYISIHIFMFFFY